MSGIEELSASILAARAQLNETMAMVLNAKSEADGLSGTFAGLSAESQANAMNAVSDQVGEAHSALEAAGAVLDQAANLAESARSGLGRAVATGRPEPPTVPAGYPRGAARPVPLSVLSHILDGDSDDETRGGHRHGSRRPGKTEFPRGWDETVLGYVLPDVAAAPDRVMSAPRGRWFADGVASRRRADELTDMLARLVVDAE